MEVQMALMLCHSRTHQTETVLFPYSCHSAILMNTWCTQATIWTWLSTYLLRSVHPCHIDWQLLMHSIQYIIIWWRGNTVKWTAVLFSGWNITIKMLWLILSSCSELQLECPQTTEPFVPTFLSILLMLSTGRSVHGTGLLCYLVLQAKKVGGETREQGSIFR